MQYTIRNVPEYLDAALRGVASLVLQHSLALFARDAYFDALPQLTRA